MPHQGFLHIKKTELNQRISPSLKIINSQRGDRSAQDEINKSMTLTSAKSLTQPWSANSSPLDARKKSNIEDVENNSNTSIALQVSRCFAAFTKVSLTLRNLTQAGARDDIAPVKAAVGDLNGRLRVWSGNIGAHITRGKSSLDHRLQDADYIRVRVIRFLRDLDQLLCEGSFFLEGSQQGKVQNAVPISVDSDSEEEEEEEEPGSPSELQQILLEISEVINCLYRLSMSIRNPKGNQRYFKTAGFDTSFYEPYDIDHVKLKFPLAKKYLHERLGKAISRRRQYFKYRERHAAKLAQKLDGTDNATELSDTTASALHQQVTALDDSKSMNTETSYATSVSSEQLARMPSIPKEAKEYGLFECPYCHTIETVRDTHGWRKHVYGDLQPYVCTFDQCTTASEMYESRREWFKHETQKHRRIWACNGHCNKIFQSGEALTDHIMKTMKLTDAQVLAMVAMWSIPAENEVEASCPLCKENVPGMVQLQKHLGRHLEELALFALPSTEGAESGEENESRISDSNLEVTADNDESDSEDDTQAKSEAQRESNDPVRSLSEGTDRREQDESHFWIPQATTDGQLFYHNTLTGRSQTELPMEIPEQNLLKDTTTSASSSTGQDIKSKLTPQRRQMLTPDQMRWLYRDAHGYVQGHWSGLEMHDWYKAGFFSPELPVMQYGEDDFEPLAQLIKRIGNSREPFLVPQLGIPFWQVRAQ